MNKSCAYCNLFLIARFADAKIFTNNTEDYAKAQIQMICDDEASKGSTIRIMPDVHPGKVGPIGLTMTVTDRILPQLLGIDIGCGVLCARVKKQNIDGKKLDKVIREKIPSGFARRETAYHRAEEFDFSKLRCSRHIRKDAAVLSLGTLGGGNHFIELDKDAEGNIYVLIHSGSRHLGKEVSDHYMRIGSETLKKRGLDVPYPLTWLDGTLMKDYLHDVSVVQKYAELNREIILNELARGMKLKLQETFSSAHNYVTDGENRILRKGAISAAKGEPVVIPINMRDGAILGIGKGNADWNESAPHGSGRRIRRDCVKNQYTVSAFKKEMKGIYSSCISAETLDEAPFAYRPMEDILERIGDSVEITRILKPVYNYKAGERL